MTTPLNGPESRGADRAPGLNPNHLGTPMKPRSEPPTQDTAGWSREALARIVELAIMRHGVDEMDLRNTLDDADAIMALAPPPLPPLR